MPDNAFDGWWTRCARAVYLRPQTKNRRCASPQGAYVKGVAMNKELKSLDKAAVEAAITAAKSAPFTAKPVMGGCARIYVGVFGVDRKTVNAIAAACKKADLIFQRKAYYGMRNAIYIGYEMGTTGAAYCKGEAFAAALSAAGIPAMVEAFGD